MKYDLLLKELEKCRRNWFNRPELLIRAAIAIEDLQNQLVPQQRKDTNET